MVYCIQFQLWKYIPGESLIWQGAAIIVYLVAGVLWGGECDNLTTATATTFSYSYNINVLDWLSNRDDRKHNIIIRILHF